MKSKVLNDLNLVLAGALIFIGILFFVATIKNKEYEKILWTAEIRSSAGDYSANYLSVIKIIDAGFYNTFDDSVKGIDEHQGSEYFTKSNSTEYVFFKEEVGLLPDSLSLKYFSADERKFYQLQTKLPYDKIKLEVKKSDNFPKLYAEINPKGKVNLYIDRQDSPSIKIETFQAQEIEGTLDVLIFEKGYDDIYNNFVGINTLTEFSDLLKNQYDWVFKANLEDGDSIVEVTANSFAEDQIYDFKEEEVVEKRSMPKIFYIKWGNQESYGIQYYFNPKEILNAFQKLEKIEGAEPITITFKLFKNKFTECELSKKGEIISIKNTIPEMPTNYVN